MQPSEETDFAKIVAALAATFRQECSAALIDGYWMGLDDLTLDVLRRAAAQAIRTSRFMPTPHELRVLAGVTEPPLVIPPGHEAVYCAETGRIVAVPRKAKP